MQESIELNKDIVKNPYYAILNWAENRVKLVGNKVFRIASLMPVSLIMPDFPYEDGTIKSNINLLLLAPSGSGKTSSSSIFSDITYNPFDFTRVTSPRFEEEMFGKQDASLICGEMSIIAKDPNLIKTMEGVLGEEKSIKAFTMRKTRDFSVNAIFFGCGIPNQLTRYLRFGFIQRTVPLVLFHTEEEKRVIAEWINKSMFAERQDRITIEDVKNYYKKIWNIQRNKDSEFQPVKGFILDKKFKEEMFKTWLELTELPFPEDSYLLRENHSAYRYMCASAMLNLFNRKIEDNKIVPNDFDMEVAKTLLKTEVTMKFRIMQLDKMIREEKDVIRLYKTIVNSDEYDFISKKIAEAIMKEKGIMK